MPRKHRTFRVSLRVLVSSKRLKINQPMRLAPVQSSRPLLPLDRPQKRQAQQARKKHPHQHQLPAQRQQLKLHIRLLGEEIYSSKPLRRPQGAEVAQLQGQVEQAEERVQARQEVYQVNPMDEGVRSSTLRILLCLRN